MSITTSPLPQAAPLPSPATPPNIQPVPPEPSPVSAPPATAQKKSGASVIIISVMAGILIAMGSLWLFVPVLSDLPFILRTQPERISVNKKIYTPLSFFILLDERNAAVYPMQFLRFNSIDFIRSVPIQGDIPHLEELTIDNNPVERLPDTLGSLSDLKTLYVTNGRLSGIPASIGQLTALENLSLTGNRITKLPESIGNLTNLVALNLAYNNLDSLPESIVNLTNLEVLDITGNRFRTFPRVLPPNIQFLFIGGNRIPMNVLRSATLPNAMDIFY